MTREHADTPPPREQLSAWLDGELTEAEAAELEGELARDPTLRAELEGLESVVRLLREEGPSQAPLGFHHRVMARVEEEHPPRVSWWAWLRRPFGIPLEGWAIGLAAAAVVMLVLPRGDQAAPAPEHESPAQKKDDPSPEPAPQPEGRADADGVTDADLPKPVGRKGLEKEPPSYSDPGVRKTSPVPTPELIPGVATTGEPQPGPPAVEGVEVGKRLPTGTATGTPQADSTAFRLVVRTPDVTKKREILRVMGQFGGARDAAGGLVTRPEPQATHEVMYVDVPQERLAEFWKKLEDLHLPVVAKADPTGIVGGATVRVVLRLEIDGTETEGK